MTQKEKELLLNDICSRIPYKQICVYKNSSYEILGCLFDKVNISKPILSEIKWVDIEDCMPYLRPMSSMTEDEKEERASIITVVYNGEVIDDDFINIIQYVEWLNAHHFDYHDLISKGLALEAPEGMYK